MISISGEKKSKPSKPIGLHDPDFTHGILNRGGYDDIKMCFLCAHRDKESCPHRGHEQAGVCTLFSLGQGTEETEDKIIFFLEKQQ